MFKMTPVARKRSAGAIPTYKAVSNVNRRNKGVSIALVSVELLLIYDEPGNVEVSVQRSGDDNRCKLLNFAQVMQ